MIEEPIKLVQHSLSS